MPPRGNVSLLPAICMGLVGTVLLAVGLTVYLGSGVAGEIIGKEAGQAINSVLSEWQEKLATGENETCTITAGEAQIYGAEESYSILNISAINVYAIGDKDLPAVEGPGQDPDVHNVELLLTNADESHNYRFQIVMCSMMVTAPKGGSRTAWSLLDFYPERTEFPAEKFKGKCEQKVKDMDNFVVEGDSTFSQCQAGAASQGDWIECREGRDPVCVFLDERPTCVTLKENEIKDDDVLGQKVLGSIEAVFGPAYSFAACSNPLEGNRITVAKISNKVFDEWNRTKFDIAGIRCNNGTKNPLSQPIDCVTFGSDEPFLLSDMESLHQHARPGKFVEDLAAAGLAAVFAALAVPCLCCGSCCCLGMLGVLKQRNDALSNM